MGEARVSGSLRRRRRRRQRCKVEVTAPSSFLLRRRRPLSLSFALSLRSRHFLNERMARKAEIVESSTYGRNKGERTKDEMAADNVVFLWRPFFHSFLSLAVVFHCHSPPKQKQGGGGGGEGEVGVAEGYLKVGGEGEERRNGKTGRRRERKGRRRRRKEARGRRGGGQQ